MEIATSDRHESAIPLRLPGVNPIVPHAAPKTCSLFTFVSTVVVAGNSNTVVEQKTSDVCQGSPAARQYTKTRA